MRSKVATTSSPSQAGNLPLGSYIKSQLFTDEAETYRKRRRAPLADEKLLAEVLACLGASRIANNLNQLAKAANTGSLIVDPDTKHDLKRASDDIHAMRLLLMQALGLDIGNYPRPPETTSQSFARAAAKPKRFTP